MKKSLILFLVLSTVLKVHSQDTDVTISFYQKALTLLLEIDSDTVEYEDYKSSRVDSFHESFSATFDVPAQRENIRRILMTEEGHHEILAKTLLTLYLAIVFPNSEYGCHFLNETLEELSNLTDTFKTEIRRFNFIYKRDYDLNTVFQIQDLLLNSQYISELNCLQFDSESISEEGDLNGEDTDIARSMVPGREVVDALGKMFTIKLFNDLEFEEVSFSNPFRQSLDSSIFQYLVKPTSFDTTLYYNPTQFSYCDKKKRRDFDDIFVALIKVIKNLEELEKYANGEKLYHVFIIGAADKPPFISGPKQIELEVCNSDEVESYTRFSFKKEKWDQAKIQLNEIPDTYTEQAFISDKYDNTTLPSLRGRNAELGFQNQPAYIRQSLGEKIYLLPGKVIDWKDEKLRMAKIIFAFDKKLAQNVVNDISEKDFLDLLERGGIVEPIRIENK